jgi:beta-lactamase class A
MSLLEAIKTPANRFDGVLGVSVKNLVTGEQAELNGDRLFPTASTFKVPVIVEFFRQVEREMASLDEKYVLREADKVPGSGILKELSEGMQVSYRDLLNLMMIVSDNTATDIVVRKVGFENINKMLDGFGLYNTRVVKYCRDILFDLLDLNHLSHDERTIKLFRDVAKETDFKGSWSISVKDNDVTTPTEMNILFELIQVGKAASRESCDTILEIMGKCQTGQYRIPKYLPGSKVNLIRKTGSLPGIRNDVGVIGLNEKGEQYILSCFTMNASDTYVAEEAIAQVSLGVYEYFTR